MLKTHRRDTILILEPQLPEITADNSRQLQAKLDEAIGETPAIVLNLTQVDHLDSSGLSVLITLLKHQSQRNGKLTLCNVSSRVQSLLKLVRMAQVFAIYADENAALEALGG